MATNVLTKHVSPEARTYAMDFQAFPELLAGETISLASILSSAPSGLVTGTPTINGSKVLFTIQGGVAGTRYHVVVQITTSGGSIITEGGNLDVTDP